MLGVLNVELGLLCVPSNGSGEPPETDVTAGAGAEAPLPSEEPIDPPLDLMLCQVPDMSPYVYDVPVE
jgi:hypothetical protein